jgi:hypothetical protein
MVTFSFAISLRPVLISQTEFVKHSYELRFMYVWNHLFIARQSYTRGSSRIGPYLRYDDDKISIRLSYDTTLPYVSSVTSRSEDDTITIWDETMTRLTCLSVSRKHIATKGGNLMGF